MKTKTTTNLAVSRGVVVAPAACARHRGLSMIEVVISMLIVSVALVSTLALVPALRRGDVELSDRSRAQWLASELLAESSTTPFDAPTVESANIEARLLSLGVTVDLPDATQDDDDDDRGGPAPAGGLLGGVTGIISGPIGVDLGAELELARSGFRSVADYDGWRASPPESADGDAHPDYDGWTRTAEVTFVDPDTLAPSNDDTGVFRVTVAVFRGERRLATLTAYRTRAGWEAR